MEETGNNNWYSYLLLYTLPFSERPPLVPVFANWKKFEEGFCSYENRQKSKWKRKEMRGKIGVADCVCMLCRSVTSSLGPYGRSSPGSSIHGDSSGKNTGVGCHALFQGIFPTQEQNPGLLHCKWILYHLSPQGGAWILEWVAYPFSRGCSQPRNQIQVSCIAGEFFTSWAIREALVGSKLGDTNNYA